MTNQRFRCSAGASRTWGRLLCVYAFVRAKGDPQPEGHKWDEHLSPSKGCYSDLGSDARLMHVTAERALELLDTMGHDQRMAVCLAKRRLSGHGTNQEARRFGLDRERRDELLEGAKEFLGWSVDPDAPLELPDLPFN